MRSMLGLLALSLAACGARTGLVVVPVDAGPPDVGHDAAIDAPPRCPFGIDDTVPASLQVSADDQATVFLYGALLDDTPRLWRDVGRYAITVFRHPSHPNVIAIRGANVFRIDGRDRGVLADLRATTEAGPQTVITDERWRLTTNDEPGFADVAHDDGAWLAPTIEGRHPIAPWGAIFGTSDAAWPWSYDSNGSAATKPEHEVVFVRRRFYFDLAGHVVDDPSPCP
jgi:hypothetical protein